jgi:hypothetical protein
MTLTHIIGFFDNIPYVYVCLFRNFIVFSLVIIRGCPKAYHPSCINRDEAFFQSKGKWNCGKLPSSESLLFIIVFIMDGFLAFLFRGLFQFQCSVLLFSIDAVF